MTIHGARFYPSKGQNHRPLVRIGWCRSIKPEKRALGCTADAKLDLPWALLLEGFQVAGKFILSVSLVDGSVLWLPQQFSGL